tara:strand:+ start:439 stop:636 length:198 start_codon:yes stop_codon:yes gene_type:complete
MVQETAMRVVDVVSIGVVVGTLSQVLPAVAALFTIIWTGFRIYETDTVQNWLARRLERKRRSGMN